MLHHHLPLTVNVITSTHMFKYQWRDYLATAPTKLDVWLLTKIKI